MSQHKNKWLQFMIVATGVFMSTLDSSMVNIALPTIMKDFQRPMVAVEWVVLAYLLTITATLLFWGHLGDRFGRGRLYGIGMLIFALGSLACSLSTTLLLLVISRFGQALGAAMLMATGPAIVKDCFPHEQLGRAMGLIGVSVSLGLMSGPSLGGFLVEYFSWRSMFFITVPIGLIFSALSIKFIPMTRPDNNATIDWSGTATWVIALLLITLTLTHITANIWSPATTLALFMIGGSLILFFIFLEKRNPHPLLPLELFKSRYFSMGIVSAILSFTVLFAAIMLTPFYLNLLRELSPSMTGLVMMAVPASIMVLAPLAGWLADHFEKRLIATTGLAIATTGVLLLSTTTATSSLTAIATSLALIGTGQAMFLSPNSAAVLGTTSPRRAGSTAALLATARNLGMLLGIALATLLFSTIFSAQTGGYDMKDFSPAHTKHFIAAFKGTLQMAATLGFMGVVASWCRGKQPKNEESNKGNH